MARLSMEGRGNGEELANQIAMEIGESGMSVELVDSVTRQVGDVTIYIMVFEKYFMRSSNRASLTVVLTCRQDQIQVDAIGAGGGQGVFLRFSWGAEESFVGVLERILRRENFA
ncbi:hypothetical protein J0B03_03630 [Alkalibacter rhizosphaerae]|uniref:Uncharacterized protein n=1 Tax=Alkalibacter rhizosphaerae TaxID=2815577 RepID=A0A975AI73_9FIRM|nr:DUF6054 family protein [Alkalibacter rhizosphaerae]QSX09172.1 hypothetical protein J0B03_03630 [Alkalibacter rhizosphaerae]